MAEDDRADAEGSTSWNLQERFTAILDIEQREVRGIAVPASVGAHSHAAAKCVANRLP